MSKTFLKMLALMTSVEVEIRLSIEDNWTALSAMSYLILSVIIIFPFQLALLYCIKLKILLQLV